MKRRGFLTLCSKALAVLPFAPALASTNKQFQHFVEVDNGVIVGGGGGDAEFMDAMFPPQHTNCRSVIIQEDYLFTGKQAKKLAEALLEFQKNDERVIVE